MLGIEQNTPEKTPATTHEASIVEAEQVAAITRQALTKAALALPSNIELGEN